MARPLVYQRFLADPQPASTLGHGTGAEAAAVVTRMAALCQGPLRPVAPRVTRFLPLEHWGAVKATIEGMPTGTMREAAHAARVRWLFSLLYIGALRQAAGVAGDRCAEGAGAQRRVRDRQSIARTTAARLREQGPDSEAAAAHIEQASTHWLRHAAGSHLSERADLKIVRDNLAHANLSTTSICLHTADDARHDATEDAHRAGWRQVEAN